MILDIEMNISFKILKWIFMSDEFLFKKLIFYMYEKIKVNKEVWDCFGFWFLFKYLLLLKV